MRIEQERVGALGLLLGVILLAAALYFGLLYSNVAVCIFLAIAIACALAVILPHPYGMSAAFWVVVLGLLISIFIPPIETEFHGWLTPGNEAMLSTDCSHQT